MKTNRITISILILVAMILSLSCGQKAGPVTLGGDGYGKTVLPNGVTVLVNHDNTTQLSSVRFLFAGGVLTENSDNNGITNLTTNMLLKGNSTMSAAEISEELDFLGSSVQLYAFRDYSVISFTSLTENFDRALEIITQSIASPAFPEEELEKFKHQVTGQIKAANDNQSQASSDLYWKTAYGDQGYGLPTIGTEESIANITTTDIKAHYDKYYGGGNIYFSIATDLPIEKTNALIEKYIAVIKTEVEPIPTPSLALQDNKTGFIPFDRNQSFIYTGVLLDPMSKEQAPYLALLNEIMGSGVSSRLWYLRQREKLAYAVYTQYFTDKYDASFRSAIGTDTSKVKLALSSLDREWAKLVSDGITENELVDARINMKNSMVFRIDKKQNRANYMAYFDYMGLGYRYPLESINMAKNITTDQINQFLKANFTDDRRFTSVVGKM